MIERDLFGEVDADHPLQPQGMEESPLPFRPLVVSWGAGVNSTALLVGMAQCGLRPDLVIFADTLGEKPETYAYVTLFRNWLAEMDFPELVIVKNETNPHGSLEQECLDNATLPSKVYGNAGCSKKWKHQPKERFLKTWPDAVAAWQDGRKICHALGIDAGEEHRARVHEDKLCVYWYPLIQWGWAREECVRAIERAGLPVPPKSACFF